MAEGSHSNPRYRIRRTAQAQCPGSGSTSKGIFASGQVLGAIDLTAASLYATGNTTNGSLITYDSTQPGNQALAINAGLTILPYAEDHLWIVGKRQATLPPGRS